MNVEWILRSAGDAAGLRDEWNTVNAAVCRLPIQDFEFWQLLLKYFGTGKELFCLARRQGRTVAVAIVEPVGAGRWQTVAPAQAPMGAWLCTEPGLVQELLAALSRRLPGIVVTLGLTRLDPDFERRPADSKSLSTMDYISTGRISAPGDFESYWQQRGRNLRHNLKRQRNRLGRENVATRLNTLRDPEASVAGVGAYGLLESAGWKGESETALHPDNDQGRFYSELFDHYSRKGESVIYEYYYDSDLAAMDMCLVRGRILTILKTTHDEQRRDTSPALLMRQESVRQMVDDDGIRKIEFYGKRMDWHTKWTDDFRTMFHINFDRHRLLRWIRRVGRGRGEQGTTEPDTRRGSASSD